MRMSGSLALPAVITLGALILTSCGVLGFLSAAQATAPSTSAAGGGPARVVAEHRVDERTLDLTVDSPAMGGTVPVRLLLPAGWSRNATRDWPVLWLLHGGFDDYRSWTAKGDAARALATAGAGRDVLVVMPDASSCGWYSDWWNRGRGGPPRWETFHLAELRLLLERDYHAGKRRAIAGPSMGGYGAMAYAARHPGMFEAAASFSGAVNTRHHGSEGISPPLAVAVSVVFGCGRVDWQRLWGDPLLQERIWRAHNPYDLAERLRGTRLYVASGDGTPGAEDTIGRHDPLERAAYAVTLSFTERLEELGIPATTHFYPGTHRWAYWARELRAALPLLLDSGRVARPSQTGRA